ELIIMRIASTAAPSPDSFWPRPTHFPDARAAASVTRTSSMARLRSGACLVDCGVALELSADMVLNQLFHSIGSCGLSVLIDSTTFSLSGRVQPCTALILYLSTHRGRQRRGDCPNWGRAVDCSFGWGITNSPCFWDNDRRAYRKAPSVSVHEGYPADPGCPPPRDVLHGGFYRPVLLQPGWAGYIRPGSVGRRPLMPHAGGSGYDY